MRPQAIQVKHLAFLRQLHGDGPWVLTACYHDRKGIAAVGNFYADADAADRRIAERAATTSISS